MMKEWDKMANISRKRRKTRCARLYEDDIQEIKLKFPKVTIADFVHIAAKSNPFIQVEAMLRKKKRK